MYCVLFKQEVTALKKSSSLSRCFESKRCNFERKYLEQQNLNTGRKAVKILKNQNGHYKKLLEMEF